MLHSPEVGLFKVAYLLLLALGEPGILRVKGLCGFICLSAVLLCEMAYLPVRELYEVIYVAVEALCEVIYLPVEALCEVIYYQ